MISSFDKSSYTPAERAGEDISNFVDCGQSSILVYGGASLLSFGEDSVLSIVNTTINAIIRASDSRASRAQTIFRTKIVLEVFSFLFADSDDCKNLDVSPSLNATVSILPSDSCLRDKS